VVDLALALRSAGIDAAMWAAFDSERDAIRRAGVELAPGELLASAAGTGAELEGFTALYLLTDEDDFNALAATVLAGVADGQVYRLAARAPSHGVVAPFTGGRILFASGLTRYQLSQRYEEGARIALAASGEPLFLVKPDGALIPALADRPLAPEPGDRAVVLRS
jgi:hypothetical protein